MTAHISSLRPAFEYTNMPPPVNMGDNPMYVAADKVPTSSGPPSSQNTLSRQFMNPLYDYEEDEGTYIDTHLYRSEKFMCIVILSLCRGCNCSDQS